MTNLTTATPRTFRGSHLDLPRSTYPGATGVLEGSAVELNGSGFLQNLTGAGTTFAGIADQSVGVSGDRINVIDDAVVQLTVVKATNWAADDVQSIVYASDGNAFTLTSTNNQKVGRVVEIISSSTTTAVCWVHIRGIQRKDA